ncbi:MAG: DUF4169 family protein [Caulobacteraceae bacterium]
MGETINLNRARKAKARQDAEAKAAGNRARFGRTKAERSLEAARAEKAARDLDAGKRER